MQVGPVSKPTHTYFHPTTAPAFKSYSSQSSLEGMGEFASRKRTSFITKAYTLLLAFVRWIISWIPGRTKGEKKFKEVDYFRVLGTDKGKVRYRMVLEGKRTDSEINFGQTYAQLEEISFPNKSDLSKLPQMIKALMETEKIDCIRTTNLNRAKLLWDSGLKTESILTFKPERGDPLSKLFKQVLQKAFQDRAYLGDLPRKVLERIEENIIRCIIADAISFDDFADPATQALTDWFNPALARAQITCMEQILGYPFDIQALAIKAEENGNPEDQMYVDAIKAVAQLTPIQKVPKTGSQIELEFPLSDLFTLMDATGITMDLPIIQEVPNMSFSKQE
jgi:hypothetical protein